MNIRVRDLMKAISTMLQTPSTNGKICIERTYIEIW